MKQLGNFIYHTAHTSGWLADAIYRIAYPVEQFLRRVRNWKAKSDAVSPEEVREFRQLIASHMLQIGVTNICNARCVFCAYPRAMDSKDLRGGVMPLPLFKKVVDEWAILGGEQIDLTHTVGDPLVDPGLVEKVAYARQTAGMKGVSFTTNGILLDRNDNYRRLIDAGTTAVFISTQGTDRETYEKAYGVDCYEQALSGIHHLLEYNRSKGEPTHIAIRFRNGQKPSEIIRSQDFVRVFKPYFSAQVRCNYTVDFDNWGGLIKPEDMVGNMRLRQTQEMINVPCRHLFGFVVRYDGSVRLCGCRFNKTDMDDMIVGNIREQSLLEISKNERTWEIISGFYSGKRPDTCLGCTLYHPINRLWLAERKTNLTAHQRKLQLDSHVSDQENKAPHSS